MALIHHQFESIHPFPDGNGRIGRILNVFYLTRTRLPDIPVLYLSRHITRHKAEPGTIISRASSLENRHDTRLRGRCCDGGNEMRGEGICQRCTRPSASRQANLAAANLITQASRHQRVRDPEPTPNAAKPPSLPVDCAFYTR